MAYLVEQHRQIKINGVRKYLKAGRGFKTTFSTNNRQEQVLNASWENNHLIFEWFKNGEIMKQRVYFAKTPTNFDSKRLWWQCPNCSRACGSLFDYGGVWWCRQCGELKYKTASASKSERDIAYFDRFREKHLSNSNHVGIDYVGSYQRPKWMRKAKWEALRKEHNQKVGQLFRKMSAQLNLRG